MSPDPWFGKIFENKEKFAAETCKFVELWQHENGHVSSRYEALRPSDIEDWAKEKVSYLGMISRLHLLTQPYKDAWKRPADSVGGLRLL